MEEEIWKDIPGLESLYQVSNLARVKRLARVTMSKRGLPYHYDEKILKSSINTAGYEYVRLTKGEEVKTYLIHRLVAMCFVPNDNPTEKNIVNHINEKKRDNLPSNLEWCSYTYNANYGEAKAKKKETFYSNQALGLHAEHRHRNSVIFEDVTGQRHEFISLKQAAEFIGVSRAAVSKAIKIKQKHIREYRLITDNT